LLKQARWSEAEPLLREAVAIRAKAGPDLEAAERVVHLYEGWGRPEKAAAWKARLGMPDLPADVFARR
jgi:hypothetical protein